MNYALDNYALTKVSSFKIIEDKTGKKEIKEFSDQQQ